METVRNTNAVDWQTRDAKFSYLVSHWFTHAQEANLDSIPWYIKYHLSDSVYSKQIHGYLIIAIRIEVSHSRNISLKKVLYRNINF